jgi:hypothetical protein
MSPNVALGRPMLLSVAMNMFTDVALFAQCHLISIIYNNNNNNIDIIIIIFYIASISQRFNNALQLRYIKMAISHVKILKC